MKVIIILIWAVAYYFLVVRNVHVFVYRMKYAWRHRGEPQKYWNKLYTHWWSYYEMIFRHPFKWEWEELKD